MAGLPAYKAASAFRNQSSHDVVVSLGLVEWSGRLWNQIAQQMGLPSLQGL